MSEIDLLRDALAPFAKIEVPDSLPDGTWVAETKFCNDQVTAYSVRKARRALAADGLYFKATWKTISDTTSELRIASVRLGFVHLYRHGWRVWVEDGDEDPIAINVPTLAGAKYALVNALGLANADS